MTELDTPVLQFDHHLDVAGLLFSIYPSRWLNFMSLFIFKNNNQNRSLEILICTTEEVRNYEKQSHLKQPIKLHIDMKEMSNSSKVPPSFSHFTQSGSGHY